MNVTRKKILEIILKEGMRRYFPHREEEGRERQLASIKATMLTSHCLVLFCFNLGDRRQTSP